MSSLAPESPAPPLAVSPLTLSRRVQTLHKALGRVNKEIGEFDHAGGTTLERWMPCTRFHRRVELLKNDRSLRKTSTLEW